MRLKMFAPKPPSCIPPLHLIRIDVLRRNLGLRPKSKAILRSNARSGAVQTEASCVTDGSVHDQTPSMQSRHDEIIELLAPPAFPPPPPCSTCSTRVATKRGSVAISFALAMPPMRNRTLLVPKRHAVQKIAEKRQQIANTCQQMQMVPPVPKALLRTLSTLHPPVPKATLRALSSTMCETKCRGSKRLWAKKSNVHRMPPK